jgi:DNA-binding NtrC family response regulator
VGGFSGPTARIVILGDDPDQTGSMHRLLEARGHTVFSTSDQTRAGELCRVVPADLLIAGVEPPAGGRDLIEHLTGELLRLTVVYVSSVPKAELITAGLVDRDARVIPQATTPDVLFSAVRAALQPQVRSGTKPRRERRQPVPS